MLNIYNYYDGTESLPGSDTIKPALMICSKYANWKPNSTSELEPVKHLIAKDPALAYKYALQVILGRWPEVEDVIKAKPEYAYLYATNVLAIDPDWPYKNGRWPEAEPYIMKNGLDAWHYAKRVLKHRWEDAEQYIKYSPWWDEYKDYFDIE